MSKIHEHPGPGRETLTPAIKADFNPAREVRAFHRFHFRLTMIYGGAVMLTMVAMVFAFYQLWMNSEVAALQKRLSSLSAGLAGQINVAEVANAPLGPHPETAYHRKLTRLFGALAAHDPDIHSIYILRPTGIPTELRFYIDFSRNGNQAGPGEPYSVEDTPVLLHGFVRPVVEDKPYQDEFGTTLSAYAPLFLSDGGSVGLLGVDVKSEVLEDMQSHMLQLAGAIMLVALLVITLVSWLVARSIREPLARLIVGTGAVAGGNLDVRLRLNRSDEFGVLGRHFDKMAEGLQERQVMRDLFGRYLSEDVARSLLARNDAIELGGQEVVVTVLFCDLKNYTTISEQLSPLQMVTMINQYLGVMNHIIDDHQGCVIEFLGDGILAVFGAPHPIPEHAELAVRCALKMREALEGLNRQWQIEGMAERWQAIGVDPIECRIGLHTGPVVAGNLGSATRMKYAVIGDTVNVAARLEALNKDFGTTILISDEVRSRLPNDLRDITRRVGITGLKGRQQRLVSHTL